MISSPRSLLFVLLLSLSLLVLSAPVRAEYQSEPADLVNRAAAVFRGFMADPNMEWFQRNVGTARAIMIVPQMLRGGFIVGGSGGRGVLVAKNGATDLWSSPAFYSLGSVSIGLQAGADASELILLIMTDQGLNAMLATDYKLGADVAVAAGPVGASAKAQTADILAFGRSQGIFGGVSVEGAAITPLIDVNRVYYGKPAPVYNILITQTLQNPQAESLRRLLPKAQRNAQPIGR